MNAKKDLTYCQSNKNQLNSEKKKLYIYIINKIQ